MDFRIFESDFVVKKIEFYQLLLLEMMNKIITKDIDVNKSNKNQLESNKLHAQRVNRKIFFGTSNGTSKAGLDSCLLGSSIQCIRMSRQTPTFTYVSEGAHDDVATCGSNKHMSLMDISTGHVILSYMESYLRDPSQVHHEWLRLLSYQPDHSSTSVASLPCNASKNWSSHHLPYDKNRVVLRKEDNVNNSDYINASYIVDANPTRPSYIFTQHPLLHTITDFWQMVWETHSNVIINLTSLADQSEPYWPSDSSPSSYHHFQVHLISQHISHPDFIVRNLLVYNLSKNYNNNNTKNNIVNDNKKDNNNDKRNNESYDTTDKASNGAAGEKEHEGEGGDGVYNNQTNIYKHDENNNGNNNSNNSSSNNNSSNNNSNNSSSNNNSSNNNSNNNSSSNSRIVTIFHYFNWPSLHVPSTSSLLSFMRTVFRHYGGGKTTLIHCSNGSERTGTYGLIDIVLRRLNSGVREVNLEATVEHLREQRVAVVATKEQYEFSLRTVAQHITNCLLTPCSCK